MVAALIRAFSWALAVSVVLYCTAAEAGEPAAEPDFIFTIPKAGMEAEEQKVVWLGPSKALRVVDSTDAAVFLPQPGNSPSAAPSSEQMNAVAYVFANGACDFTKQVEYKELFPEYNKPVWDRSPPAEATVEGDSSPSLGANYTFTSPPAEALGKVASFCVRFMVEKPVKSEAGTQEGQEGPNRNSGGPPPGTSEEGGDLDIGGNHPRSQKPDLRPPENPPSQQLASSASDQTSNSTMNGSEQDGGGAVNGGTGSRGLQGQDPYHPKEEEEEERGSPETNRPEAQPPVHAVPPAPTPLLVNVGSDGRNPNETSSHKEATSTTSKVPGEDKTSTAPSRAPENLRDPSGADEKNQTAPPLDGSPVNGQHTRLRRLSEANETVHQYLTLVVHSGGWSVSKGMATVSASLLAVAAAVVLAF